MLSVKRSLLVCLIAGTSLLVVGADTEAAAIAPHKGFVYVQTSFFRGDRAADVPIHIEKLSGNYPIPPGRYATDEVGRIWVALYPGVYRFSAKVKGAMPKYIDVGVSSRSESYIFFLIPRKP